ncbi:hypothetical protein JK358_08320 [Nocardia sp. 2]|uniref:PPE family domain-containing protein n=1 Tax=Nocardia acididurans TaxID=2802282 RepID=A0ABS1M2Y1_9NOCA|nr:hypothetical protein [Nocardia acididurans]MBL1074400.1 hypothetical protein [Nocardia acididurans]
MGPRPDGTDALRRNAHRIQQGAEREQGRISHDGVDPDYIQRLEHFGGLSHERIHECVQAMDPGAMRALAELWTAVADNLSGAVTGLHMTMQGALSESMAGRIATAAEAATYEFIQQAVDVTEVAHSTGHRIEAAACAAEALRKTVPPPVDSTAAEREEQFQLALAAVEANYVPIYPAAGSRVPAFAPIETGGGGVPGSAGGDADPAVRSAGSGAVFVPAGSRHESRSSAGQLAGLQPDGTGGGNPGDAGTHGDRSHSRSAGDAGYSDPSGTETPSPASDIATTAASTDGGRVPGLATPSLSGPPSAPGVSGLPNSPGIPSPHDAVRGLPGSPLTGTAAAPPLTGVRGGPATMGWMPGMYPPGARGGPDEDSAHRTPDWLLRARERELLGTPAATVSPVLGAEFPSARPESGGRPADDTPSPDPKR